MNHPNKNSAILHNEKVCVTTFSIYNEILFNENDFNLMNQTLGHAIIRRHCRILDPAPGCWKKIPASAPPAPLIRRQLSLSELDAI